MMSSYSLFSESEPVADQPSFERIVTRANPNPQVTRIRCLMTPVASHSTIGGLGPCGVSMIGVSRKADRTVGNSCRK